jgi:hypothetical protein
VGLGKDAATGGGAYPSPTLASLPAVAAQVKMDLYDDPPPPTPEQSFPAALPSPLPTDSLVSPPGAEKAPQPLVILRAVLKNVCQNPENVRFRTLPLSNLKFNLMWHSSEPCRNLLKALGFILEGGSQQHEMVCAPSSESSSLVSLSIASPMHSPPSSLPSRSAKLVLPFGAAVDAKVAAAYALLSSEDELGCLCAAVRSEHNAQLTTQCRIERSGDNREIEFSDTGADRRSKPWATTIHESEVSTRVRCQHGEKRKREGTSSSAAADKK